MRFENGGSFEVASGATLTIEGSLDGAPMQKIFGGAGSVMIGSRVPAVHPEWWGATAAPVPPEQSRGLGAAAHRRLPPPSGFPPRPVHSRPRQQAGADMIDDFSAIQSAINSLGNGGEVRFSPGQYELGSTGVVVGSLTTLIGAGGGVSRLHFSGASGSAITLKPNTYLPDLLRQIFLLILSPFQIERLF